MNAPLAAAAALGLVVVVALAWALAAHLVDRWTGDPWAGVDHPPLPEPPDPVLEDLLAALDRARAGWGERHGGAVPDTAYASPVTLAALAAEVRRDYPGAPAPPAVLGATLGLALVESAHMPDGMFMLTGPAAPAAWAPSTFEHLDVDVDAVDRMMLRYGAWCLNPRDGLDKIDPGGS